jgi:uncharacterized membrane-anchored protein
MNKLPQITIYFWLMKIAATTLGETVGDLLSMTLNIGYAVSSLILIAVFLATLTAQLFSKSHHPFLYWLVILSTSTAGTTMSDYMDRTLELGYVVGSAILLSILLLILLFWKITVGNLSVQNINSKKSELLYWITILFSNTLGTALGDFLADSSGLGFVASNAIISGALGLILIAYYFTKISRVGLFWIAFVLTRPFGATFGDILTKTHEKGGLDIGTAGSSAVLFLVLITLIICSGFKQKNANI